MPSMSFSFSTAILCWRKLTPSHPTTAMSPSRRSSPRSSPALRPVSKKMDFVVLRQSMSTVQCVLVASVDAGVSTQMVHFAASLSKESIVDVEGIVTLPKEPFKATTQQVRKATASIGRSPHFRSTWTMQPVVKQNLRRLNKYVRCKLFHLPSFSL
uniref:Uncharacterized protein n=1 Tax=Aegilops tauschii subsp. strangulata TaxID=200361 RepID=A0A453G919_AEGTS